jgi:hypothetical protein
VIKQFSIVWSVVRLKMDFVLTIWFEYMRQSGPVHLFKLQLILLLMFSVVKQSSMIHHLSISRSAFCIDYLVC